MKTMGVIISCVHQDVHRCFIDGTIKGSTLFVDSLFDSVREHVPVEIELQSIVWSFFCIFRNVHSVFPIAFDRISETREPGALTRFLLSRVVLEGKAIERPVFHLSGFSLLRNILKGVYFAICFFEGADVRMRREKFELELVEVLVCVGSLEKTPGDLEKF